MIAAALVLGAAAAVAPLPHTRSGHGPGIVLVHGLGGDRHVWDDIAAKLASEFTVIAVDLPGHGEAPAPARFDAGQIAARILATADAEKLGPAILVGHSLGGYIVAHAAGKARAVVLVDIGIGKLWPPKELDELRSRLAKDREGMLQSWFADLCTPAELARILPGVRKLPDATLVGYARMMGTQPTPPQKLRKNALLMASQLILPGKRTQAEELAAVGFGDAKGLRVERFTTSLHWIFWDEPEKFLTTLVDFAHAVGN